MTTDAAETRENIARLDEINEADLHVEVLGTVNISPDEITHHEAITKGREVVKRAFSTSNLVVDGEIAWRFVSREAAHADGWADVFRDPTKSLIAWHAVMVKPAKAAS